jgi:hypothetical protein
VRRDAHSLYRDCLESPDWYNSTTLGSVTDTRHLIDNVEHMFTGTGTACGTKADGTNMDGEACNMQNVMIVGFDVCDDTRASAHAVFFDLKFECNVGEFIHNNGGGMTLDSAAVENFIEAQMDDGSGNDL